MNIDCVTKGIALPDGWSGRTLTRTPAGLCDTEAIPLPSADQWRKFFQSVLTDPTRLSNHRILKHSPTGQVFRATIETDSDAIEVVAKQSLNRGPWRRVGALLRPSRSRRNFERGLTLLQAELHTATPLACFERSRLAGESWLVTGFVADLVDLDEIALRRLPGLDPNRIRVVKDRMIDATAELLRNLEAQGLTHRDFKASNILLRNWNGDGDRPTAWLLDLDGIMPMRTGKTQRWRPVVRLTASLTDYAVVTRTDLIRLLRACLAPTRVSADTRRDTLRAITTAATRYARNARARKTHKLEGYAGD